MNEAKEIRPGITLLNCDGWAFLREQPDNAYDHAFIDPIYGLALPWLDIIRVVKDDGNIIVFERPNTYFDYIVDLDAGEWNDNYPNYIHEWQQAPSPRNVVNHMSGGNVTHIYVWNRGVYNGRDVTGMHWENYTGVWHDVIEGRQYSPFQKAESTLRRLLEIYTKPGDKILDPTCGVATSLVAGIITGRRVTGCEIDSATYQLAAQRLEMWK